MTENAEKVEEESISNMFDSMTFDDSSGITGFMSAFESLPYGDFVQSLSDKLLKNYVIHSQMAETILKSTITGYLTRHGSDDIHHALSSRWQRITLNPIYLTQDNLLGFSLEIVFILENTVHNDCTDEMMSLVEKVIQDRNLHKVILQAVVNNRSQKFGG